MQAKSCYQVSRKEASILKWVDQASWPALCQEKGASLGGQTRGFSGKVGELFYENEKSIWIGTGNVEKLSAIALAAVKLPAGAYFFEESLSFHEQLMWSLSQYRFDKYKLSDEPIRSLCVSKDEQERVLCWAESIFLVRDLINTPTQDMGPVELAEAAMTVAHSFNAKVSVCEGGDLLTAGYPAVHAVGRAALAAPRVIQLNWGKPSHPLVVLVGKGVCFDSGGLDIKSAHGMRLMKKDMGGAAHVLGLARWIMASQLPIRIQVLIPAVENAVGPDAYRPGDVIRMRSGLTVEIENTDAEGRLILADALTKACEANPDLILDFSTLTGAARVAVGTDIAAMFTNDEAVATALATSAECTQDPIWRLPLYAPYEAMLMSSVADLLNASASSYAGAITAALFLKRFVKPTIPWVHFDLMAWNTSSKPGKPEGGEAMSLRAVGHYLVKRFVTSQ